MQISLAALSNSSEPVRLTAGGKTNEIFVADLPHGSAGREIGGAEYERHLSGVPPFNWRIDPERQIPRRVRAEADQQRVHRACARWKEADYRWAIRGDQRAVWRLLPGGGS